MSSVIRTFVIGATIAAAATSAGAQPPGRGVGGGIPGGVRGGIPGGGPPAGTIEFMGVEMPIGPIVTGAPFSGEGVTASSQTLGDGTKITRTVNAKIYRDSQGRIRREQTILGLGALSPGDAPTIVTIVDPVAGVQYVLDATRKEARKSPIPAFGRGGARGRQGGADAGGVPPPPPPPPPPPDGLPRDGGPVGRGRRGGPPSGLPNAPEQLGTKSIEGVNASGVRRTETIPAGTIGNDRPI